MKKLEAHDSLRHVPMMPSHEIDALARDIEENGQQLPIVLLEGKIIDGRNRHEACRRLKREPTTFEVFTKDPKKLVATLNYFRKHWTTFERAHFAALLTLNNLEGRPKETVSNDTVSETEAAKQMGVSRSSVAREKAKIKGKPKPEPKDKGTPEEPKDERGNVVPQNTRPYWNRIEEAKSIMAMLRAAKHTINELIPDDPMWCEVGLQGMIGDLNSAISRFGAAIPAYVCPYCKGIKVDSCKECSGRGCVSKYMWNQHIPEEMKK